jgi:CDP-glycerol glycerophosphotransferase
MLRIKRACLAVYYILYMAFCKIISIPITMFNPDLKDIWIVSERGVDARDNGYHFFKYIRTYHKEINAWFIIDTASADYEKVRKYENVIPYRSFKHMLYLVISKIQISTHDQGCTPNMVVFHWLNKYHMVPGKKVFLQHGIIKDNIKWYHADEFHTDLFICSADEEYEYVLKHYGHPKDIVKLLGMCRYDGFGETTLNNEKQILFMPTWRNWLNECEEHVFTDSQYFHQINMVLNDVQLNKGLKRNGYKLLFYPHYESQRFLHCFSTDQSNMEICSFKEYDVHTLLKDADMLITDYSSVFFDMAYQDKPILFFQFDQDDFETYHYQKGYIEYNEFGPVSATIEELKQNIMLFFENPNIECYTKRYHQFFGEKTNNNCKLIFDAIKQML